MTTRFAALLFALLPCLSQAENELPDIGAFDEYNQWKEALGAEGDPAAATFSKLPPGFELDLVYSATPEDGSWVSMTFDPAGGLILAREKRGLLRAELAADGASISSVNVVEDSLLECRGLLFAHGSLYANANNSKGLYRLRDTDGDGTFDDVTLLRTTGGSVGHGRNDLALGPDGKIYAIHGDSVQIPEGAEFRTPTTAEKFRSEGHLVRTDKDGKTWEIVATGLRNPFGIDFNPDGEPFTYDADNESDIGLPFYRPTRINHLVSGADYGWRQGGQSWPVYAADSLPTNSDIGHGSPTAVKFGTRSHFPNRYKDALFILDWAYGRIIAAEVIPHGSSYSCRSHIFLRGRPLNVTDLDFGSDGAMYFITGGRKTRSALYRVRYTGKIEPRPTAELEDERTESSAKARDVRRDLERFHHAETSSDELDSIWEHLGNPDPWIRHAARTALEHQPSESWMERALAEAHPDRAPTALLALARTAEPDTLGRVVQRQTELKFEKNSVITQFAILRSYEICMRRKCPISSETKKRIVAQIGSTFPSENKALNRQLAALLIEFEIGDALPSTLRLLSEAESQPETLYYLDLLSRSGTNPAWTNSRREAFARQLGPARVFDGDRSLPAFVTGIRDRFLAGLDGEQREHLIQLIEPPKNVPLPAEPAKDRKPIKEWSMKDLDELTKHPGGDRLERIRQGREIFTEALCSRCHQVGALGTPAGPNLTAVSSRFAPNDLIKSILEPSDVVAEIYQNHVIKMKDGTALFGRVIRNDLRGSTFDIAPDPFAPWRTESVKKADVATHTISPASPMPSGLLNTFTASEIQALILFLQAGGRDPKPE